MHFEKIHVASVLDHVPVPMALFDLEMRYVLASRCWIDTFEIEGSIIGRSHYEVFPDIPERWKAIHRRALGGETIRGDDDRFERSNGRVYWLRWEVTPWHLSNGAVGGIIIWGEDITKWKESVSRLDTMQSRLAAVMQAAPVGIAYTNDTSCQEVTGNPTLCMQFAITPGENVSASAADPEALGRRISYLREGRLISDAEFPLQRAVNEGRPIPAMELEVVMPDGRRWDSIAYGAPVLGIDGQIIGGVCVMVDITERRKMERILRDCDKRKDEFLAMLGHELRNPLSPVTHGVHILEGKVADDSGKKLLAMMQRQLKHLTRLVDDLLEVSRINQGKIELNKTHVDLSDLVSDAIEECRETIAEAKQKFHCSDASAPLPLFADATRITQVIANLLVNASKFTASGGIIEVCVSQEGNFAVITVRDNGCGIAPNELSEVFELFAQVKGDGGPQGGLGIGLALVRRLVEMHGGSVVARSEGIDHGSEFEVRLPISQ